jgi:16S rRNA (cytidine1402-2'-O)-methyltransferase
MDQHVRKGTLYLIPSLLAETEAGDVIPGGVMRLLPRLKFFIVEELRTARRFLKKCAPEIVIDDLTFLVFNEHSAKENLSEFLNPLLEGHDTGLLSEAGIPCVADPGSEIVRAAHEAGIRVKPLSGPSSIILALAASGFNGQNFVFHGYLPVDKNERIRKIREIEKAALSGNQTQVFIETPYRNTAMIQAILSTCHNETLFCLATGISSEDETIISRTIKEWKNNIPDPGKHPAVFLLFR